jgi:hypothetical protein
MKNHSASHVAAFARPVLLLAAVIVLAFIFGGSLWSVSVDLAHHYALVARLLEHGNAAFPFDPSLAEMNVYPRVSHQIAAGAAMLSGSPLKGMAAVAAASVAMLWAILVWLVLCLPQRMALLLAAALAAMLALNRFVLHLPLHGDEVVESYFYAQMVGQVFCAGALLFAFHLERSGARRWVRYALMIPALYLLTNVHLLPTLLLLMAMALMIAMDLLLIWREERGALLRSFAAGACLWLMALATVVLQPAFRAMQSLSNHNGDMTLPYLPTTAALMCYCGSIALVSAVLLWHSVRRQWRQELAALKYLGLYGLAVSGLCLVQGMALWAGFGSEYAIRKYGFALNTVALLELAALPALLRWRGPQPALARTPAALLHAVLPSVLTVLAVAAIMQRPAPHQMEKLVELERGVMALRDSARAEAGKASYVIGADGGTALAEYMLSIAHLHSPRMENVNAFSLLAGRDIADWSAVGKIITAEKGGFDQIPACRSGPVLAGLSVVDARCLLDRTRSEQRIEFTAANKVFLCKLAGFSQRESAGTWTDGPEASLRCPVPRAGGRAFRQLAFIAAPYNAHATGQRVTFTLDGQQQQALFNAGRQTVELPLGEAPSGEILLRLQLQDAVSPRQMGQGGDARRLGLSVQAIEFR